MAYQPLNVIQCQIHLQTNNQFYFKQFSLTCVHSLPNTSLFQAIQFSQTVLIQTIQFSISIDCVYTHLNVKAVLFQTIQFSISTRFSSIGPIDRALSGANTSCQSGPRIDSNEGILRIPQSSIISGTSLSGCLVLYPGHSLGGGLTLLQRCSWCILQPQQQLL